MSAPLRAGLRTFSIGLVAATSMTLAASAAQAAPTSEAPPAGAVDPTCIVAPGVVGDLCEVVGGVTGGVNSVVGGGTNAVLGAMVDFVVDGAGWLLGQLVGFIESSTSPDVTAGWFRAAYGDMALIGLSALLPFLLLALMQALLRQDMGMMLRSTFGFVPLAAIGTAGAVVVVDLLVDLTDQLSAWIARGMGDDLSAFASGVISALARSAGPDGGAVAGLAALIGGAVIAFAAFVIWLELLLRQAAIYVAVLFLPLGFMAMVWPATSHWMRRLAQGLLAIILSKFVIVAVMALAASAVDADVAEDGFGVVMSGGALLGLAALAPYVLLRLVPVFDAGLSSQLEGTLRRPTAAVGTPVHGRDITGLIRRRVGGAGGGMSEAAGVGGAARAGGSATAATTGAGVATAGVGLAASGVVAGTRRAVGSTARAAEGSVGAASDRNTASGRNGHGAPRDEARSTSTEAAPSMPVGTNGPVVTQGHGTRDEEASR